MNIMPRKDKDGRQVVRNNKASWRLRWDWADAGTGERKHEYRTFYGTKAQAEDEWIKHEATIQKAGKTYTKPSDERVAEYLTAWLAGKEADLRPATVDSYSRMLRTHIIPAVGAVAMSDLTPRHIQDMMAGMRRERPAPSPRTVSYARTLLRTALQDAVNLGLLPSNPVDRTKGPKQAPKQRDAFTLEEGRALFSVADRTRMGPLLRFAFFSGMRRGEILGLRWQDVDLDGETAMVAQAQVMVKGRGVTQGTKTAAGIRTVPLVPPALEALRMQKERQAFERRAAGEQWQDMGLVFTTADGKPLGPNNVSRDFRRLRDLSPCPECNRPTSPTEAGGTEYRCGHCEREWHSDGLPRLPFHALRHTAVSVLLGAGVDLAMVSKVIGHKRYSLTVDQYGHLTPDAGKKISAQVADFLDAPRPPRRARK